MERQARNQTITAAVPRPIGFVMLGVTLAAIVMLLFGLAVYVA